MLVPLPGATSDDLDATSREAVSRDPRAVQILAKTIYRELRQSGVDERGVMAVAGELLSLLTSEVKDRRNGAPRAEGPAISVTRGAAAGPEREV